MKNQIVVNFLLTFAFLVVLLHQWVGWRAEGHKLGNKASKLFDKGKCLKTLKRRTAHTKTHCHKLYLRNMKGESTASSGFCIPPFTKYLIVERGIECGMYGFWIRDRKKCLNTFTPDIDEGTLKSFMRAVGYAKFIQFSVISDHRLVFFSDTCIFHKRGKMIKCGMNKKIDAEKYIYRLSPQMIPYPLYDADAGC